MTLSDFLQNVVPRESGRLAGAVLICDEAGLTSNQQGAELLEVAERHAARVLFLGDSRQHSSVEAGDFLRVLESHSQLHRVELTAIRRQQNKAYRHAVRWLAAGATRGGLERLDQLGWLKESGAGYLKAAADDFLRLSEHGRKPDRVLAVTPTWAEHEVFTAELRAHPCEIHHRDTMSPCNQQRAGPNQGAGACPPSGAVALCRSRQRAGEI